MDKGIIIDDNLSRRKLLTLNFEMYTGIIFDGVANADAAMEYLKKNPNVKLIICKNNVGDENTILKTFYYVQSNKINAPILCLGTCIKLAAEKNVKIIEDVGSDLKPVIKWVAKKLGITAEMMSKIETDKYYPISLRNFNLLEKAPCEIFKSEDGKKFEIFLKPGEEISAKMVKELIFAKINELYVNKFDRLKFVNDLSKDAVKIMRSKNSQRGDKINATGALFEESKKLLSKVGLDQNTIKMAEESVTSFVNIARGTNELAELLAILENSGGGYLYKHSILSATIGFQCINALHWGNKGQKECICFVAYFHDITLPREELSKIASEEDLKALNLPGPEAKEVENHAFKASQLVQDYPKVPFGAVEVILQHHGAVNGIGFMGEINSRISPLACVFQVVEAFVEKIIDAPTTQKLDAHMVLSALGVKYNKGAYKEAIEALKTLKF